MAKKFPITCHTCRRKKVIPVTLTEYTIEHRIGRGVYRFIVPELPVNQCRGCGEVYFNNDSSDAIDRTLAAGVKATRIE
jgi:YgiT-type zinc finger domain-containing protein